MIANCDCQTTAEFARLFLIETRASTTGSMLVVASAGFARCAGFGHSATTRLNRQHDSFTSTRCGKGCRPTPFEFQPRNERPCLSLAVVIWPGVSELEFYGRIMPPPSTEMV